MHYSHETLQLLAQAFAELGSGCAKLAKALDSLAEDAEISADIAEADKVDRSKTIPGEVVHALLEDGAKPVQILRKWRGLTQAQLSEAVGIAQASLSELENKPGSGQIETLVKIARALDVGVELLLPSDMTRAPAETEAA